MRRYRWIKGIPFILYKEFVEQSDAKKEAEELRKNGYYVRILKKSKNYKVWVSKNPRWFYQLFSDYEK